MTRADDIREIEQLQRRFARLNDEGRWEEAAALFTEDGRFARPSDPAHPVAGRAAILQAFLARPRGAGRRHLVANPEVELLDGDHARATCWSILLVEPGDGSGTVTVGGFEDRLARTAAGWRFASRTGFTTVDPVPYAARPAPGGRTPSETDSAAPPGHPVPPLPR